MAFVLVVCFQSSRVVGLLLGIKVRLASHICFHGLFPTHHGSVCCCFGLVVECRQARHLQRSFRQWLCRVSKT